MKRTPIVIGIVAAVCVVGIYLLTQRKGGLVDADDESSPAAVATLVPVETSTLKRATLHGFVEAYGTITAAPAEGDQPPASAKVQSQLAGRVARTFVTEGQAVEKGAPLFDLDSRNAKIAFERAAQAAKYARENAERQQRLYNVQNTSAKALQDAEALAASADADLSNAETQQAWVHVTAPLRGVVTHINVRPGESVDLTTVLAEVTDLSRLILEAEIPSAEAVGVKPGQSIQILTTPVVTATLSFTSPAVDPTNDTVLVRAALPPESGLRLGQFVSLRIATSEHADVLVAPVESVVTDANGRSVVATVEGDEATTHVVTTGLREDNLVEVAGKDLRAGQSVVTVGAYGLPEKTKVAVGNPGKPEPVSKESAGGAKTP